MRSTEPKQKGKAMTIKRQAVVREWSWRGAIALVQASAALVYGAAIICHIGY